MIHLILFGPPGAGKGTQATALVSHFNFRHVSTGDLLRSEIANQTPLGLEAKQFIDAGELVPDDTVIGMIRGFIDALNQVPGVIFDGFPRTVAQAESFDRMLVSIGQEITALLSLEVPHDELVSRLILRGESSGRSDDTDLATIENRISVYEAKTKPLIEYYHKQNKYVRINGVGSIEDITGRLIGSIHQLTS